MNKNLLKSACIKLFAGFILLALLLFLPAGTLKFMNGWRLLALLFIPMLLIGAIMLYKAPDLLEKRLHAKEQQGTQRLVVGLSALIFVIGFSLCSLDFRCGWSNVPEWLTSTASLLFLISYGMYAEVMHENAYLSRAVEIQKEQKVIDTGLYGIVRHPMYSATIIMFTSMPLILGSFVGFLLFLVYPLVIAIRIGGEEELLEQELKGYITYKKKVKYRLLPFIW